MLTTLEAFKPGSTDSNKKLGASLSSSFTKHLYANTGVRWSENIDLYNGIKFPFFAASLNLTDWSTAQIQQSYHSINNTIYIHTFLFMFFFNGHFYLFKIRTNIQYMWERERERDTWWGRREGGAFESTEAIGRSVEEREGESFAAEMQRRERTGRES